MSDSLSNPDLAPVPPDQRTWSSWNIAALWVGMAVCIPTYMLAAGMIAAGMAWWQAVLTVMLGNVIVLMPMLLNGHGGTKYGIPFPVLIRSSFGTVGAHVPSLARALVACGWFGIQTWIGGAAIYQIIGALGWVDIVADGERIIGWLDISGLQFGCFLVFWTMNLLIVIFGINCIKWVETWAAPFLLLMGLALLMWAFVKVDSMSQLFVAESQFETRGDFWRVFFPQLTGMVCFWATLSLNIPDFTRYCRSQRDQVIGQVIGLPTTMTLFCFISVMVTAATVVVFGEAIWDPVILVSRLGSVPIVIVSMIALTIATLSTNIAANVVSPANGIMNVWPKLISFRMGGIITCVIGVVIMPWRLLDNFGAYIFTWLIGYGVLLGPITGIMICDYFVLRRTKLNRAALYDPKGEFAGVNWRAIIVLAAAVLPNVPGFLNAATNPSQKDHVYGRFFDANLDGVADGLFASTAPLFAGIYTYAWFVGLAIAIGLYYVLMFGRAKPAIDNDDERRTAIV